MTWVSLSRGIVLQACGVKIALPELALIYKCCSPTSAAQTDPETATWVSKLVPVGVELLLGASVYSSLGLRFAPADLTLVFSRITFM